MNGTDAAAAASWRAWDMLLALPADARVLELRAEADLSPGLARAGSYDAALVVAHAARAGLDIGDLLTALRGALRPGGSLALSLSNPRYDRLASLIPDAEPGGPRGLALRLPGASPDCLRPLLAAAGFSGIRVFAPLPGRLQPRFLLPVGEPYAVRHFLSRALPRQTTLSGRLRHGLARAAAVAGLFDRLAPGYELVAALPEAR